MSESQGEAAVPRTPQRECVRLHRVPQGQQASRPSLTDTLCRSVFTLFYS